MNPQRKRRLFGLAVDNLSMDEALDEIERLIRAADPAYVVTPNAQHITLLDSRADFRRAYAEASLILPDSIPLIWLSRLLGRPLKQRVAGSDILPRFTGRASRRGYRLGFLGSAPGVAARAAEILGRRAPGLNVVCTLSPPLGFQDDPAVNAAYVAIVREAKPDVLFVCLGTPKAEEWVWRNRRATGVPVSVCVGAAFDFVAGIQKRAPGFIQKIGLEWFFRFCGDPIRLWNRYTLGNLRFLYLAGRELFSLPPRDPRMKSTLR
jgi:N-acetylglucosaminyldiphosphoundecaprenol N-acetyl-beta-D-mannosaminyltransferase